MNCKSKLALMLFFTSFIASVIIAVPNVNASPGTYYVSTAGSDANSGGAGDPWLTIQHAINNVASGETIVVAAGTYTVGATILVSKTVTLLGPQADVDPRPSTGGRSGSEAIVQGDGVLGTVIRIQADNVVLNGFTVKTGKGDIIYQSSAYTGTTVKYNIIHDGQGDEGIQLKQCTNGVIEYNYVYDIASPGDAINFADSSDCAIRFNEVYNIGSENAAIYVYGSNHMQIVGNLVHHVTQNDGIKLGDKNGNDAAKSGGLIEDNIVYDVVQDGITVYTSDVLVEGNEIYNSGSENGVIYLAYAISNITIHCNGVHDNVLSTSKRLTSAGILLEYRVDASNVSVCCNNIYNNNPYGCTNEASSLLKAENNWWGDASGPYHPTLNSGGLGNRVSDNIDFDPWLSSPACPPPPPSPPVGGYWVPISNTALLAPWITLASVSTVVTVSFVFFKRRRKQQN